MRDELQKMMEELRLRGMAAHLDEALSEAKKGKISLQEILLKLLEAESKDRQTKALASRTTKAKMPWKWALDTFPFKQQPGLSKTQMLSLGKLDFMKAHENIVFIGKPGRGKTGLAISLLRLALQQGYRGRFYNTQDLLDDLYASLADRSTSNLLKTIANYDILVIDELGYLSLND